MNDGGPDRIACRDLFDAATLGGARALGRGDLGVMRPGEFLGVVGESGVGKSMTGAATLGLLERPGHIAGGEMRLAGRRIDGLGDHAMENCAAAKSGQSSRIP